MFKLHKLKGLSAIPIVVILMLCGAAVGIISYNVAMDVEYEAEMGTYEAYETLTGDSIGREPPKNVVGGVGGSISPGQVRPAAPEEEFPDDDSTAVYSLNYMVYCEKTDEYYIFEGGDDSGYSFTTKNLEGISWYDMLSDDSWHPDLDIAFSERTPLLYIEGSGGMIIKEMYYYVSDADEMLNFEPKSTTLKQTVPWNHDYSAGEYDEYWASILFVVDEVKAPADKPPVLIPEGGRYETADGDIYGPGDEFPAAPEHGDSYYYGDYEYKYNHNYHGYGGWWEDYEQNGWGVKISDRSKTSYGPLLSEIAGKPLVAATELFRLCENLKKVPELPETLKTIGDAFSYCSSLTEFPEIPMSVTDISGAFAGTLFSSIPSLEHLTNITNAGSAFSGCPNLTIGPKLPDSIEYASYIYSNCYNLTTVTNIPEKVVDLDWAFYGCSSLTNIPAIPSNVESMRRTFVDCESLEEVIIKTDNVTYLQKTFAGCSSLKGISKFPQNLEDMYYTFEGCVSMESIPEFPSKLQDITYAFSGCSSLTNIPAIPSNIQRMNGAFRDCESLEEVVIMTDNVQYLESTFAGCSSLKKISKFPQNLVGMSYAFEGCISLESVPSLPSKLQSMAYAFKDCISLKRAPGIPSGVTNLTGTFQNCSSLSGQIMINAGGADKNELKNINYCFAGTTQPIHLLGVCRQTTKAKLAATSSAGNITY